jgi:hypothetical protein
MRGYVQSSVYHPLSHETQYCFTATQPKNIVITSELIPMLSQNLSITVFLLFEFVTFFPESSWSGRAMNIIIPKEHNVSGFSADND